MSDVGDEAKCTAPSNSLLYTLKGTTYFMLDRGLDLGRNAGPSYKILQPIFRFLKKINDFFSTGSYKNFQTFLLVYAFQNKSRNFFYGDFEWWWGR